jgi:FkbM family methyltransferase
MSGLPKTPNSQRWLRLGLETAGGDFFELVIEQIYRAWLGPAAHAVDGGSNIGRHTLPLAECVGPAGLVVAIEAIPELARYLATVCSSSLAQVQVVNCAVGEQAGSAEFVWVTENSPFSGLRQRSGIPEHTIGSIERIDVPVRRMDDILSRIGARPSFIKLDLEGGEFHALSAATATLKAYGPLVVFENGRQNAARLYDYDKADWFGLFAQVGYATYTLFGEPFTAANWLSQAIPWYCIAVPRGSNAEEFVRQKLDGLIAEAERKWLMQK